MKPGLSLKVSQSLTLTPQLQQSIRLLQLSTLELEQEVEQMLSDNPFLEQESDALAQDEFGLDRADAPPANDPAADGSPSGFEDAIDLVAASLEKSSRSTLFDDSSTDATEPASAPQDALDWDGDGTIDMAADDGEWGGEAPASARHGDVDGQDPPDTGSALGVHVSLQAHLLAQTAGLRLSALDRAALHYLIESLDDDGYLPDSLSLLATLLAEGDPEQTDELKDQFAVSLKLLQSLEPTGVGARDLAECLTLQLQALQADCAQAQRAHRAATQAAHPDEPAAAHFPGADDPCLIALALRICAQPLDLLARRDCRKLSPLCEAPEAQVRAAIALIGHLEPKPGRRFADVSRNIVVPDVIVTQTGSARSGPRFCVQINPDVMPRLRVQDAYAQALRGHKGEGAAALGQRLQEARWFIKNIQQRFDTILRVSSAIVERQKAFLIHGELAMRPLVLREIADELGVHESTISRVTTAKYMATPQGTFELKYFFGSGLETDSGAGTSSTAVRALIKQLVAAEDPQKPLSDSQIADLLKAQGIECARRTVAKYREALKIAPGHLRRAL